VVPFALGAGHGPNGVRGRRWVLWPAAAAWLLLVTAAARPVWLGPPVDLPVSGRDLLLAVDLSGSMGTKDFKLNGQQVDRLTAVKAIAGDFIQRRIGDRLGLILFGLNAYVQSPLTFDRKTVNTLLQESAIGLAGDQTAIGNAIGLAVKELRRNPKGNKVLILLTDGANNAGEVDPLEAAKLAAREGLTIYTIGIGADSMLVPSLFGAQRVNPSQDLDEDTLRAIAKATGGRYFRARDSAALDKIYGIIDGLQPVDQERQTFRPRRSLFYWPLAMALITAVPLLWMRVSGYT
jgi:Ca-activated chloride channel family protein